MVLEELIEVMSAKEAEGFVQFLKKKNKRSDVRNIDLFHIYYKSKKDTIREELNTNAYNVLKKRVADALIEYLANTTIEEESNAEIGIIKLLLLSRKLFLHSKYKSAFRLLKRAEKQATSIAHFSLLNEIYHTSIQYSHHEYSDSQEDIFKKFEENQDSFQQQERLNLVYAKIKKSYLNQKGQGDGIDINKLINESFTAYGISEKDGINFKSLYQIASIIDIAGTQTKDYHSVKPFFESKIEELRDGEGDTEKFILYQIDMLYALANIYFRKKDFNKSEYYLEQMRIQMARFDGKYQQQRLAQYGTLLALNLNYSGKYMEAEGLLMHILSDKSHKKENLANTVLTLTMIKFQQGKLKEAKQLLGDLKETDNWYLKHSGLEWLLNKKMLEILLFMEISEVTLVESLITSFSRKYISYFKENKNLQALQFLKLIKKHFQQPDQSTSKEFKNLVDRTLKFKKTQQEDIFMMSFYAWLKSKMEERNVYEVTLELVGN